MFPKGNQFAKLGKGHTGKKHTPEAILKIKEARKRQGNNVWNKGKKNVQKGFWRDKKRSIEARKKMSESKIGEKHPQWQGGISFDPYTTDWTETLKRAIRQRDNYICQECGIHQDELDRKLDVHHKDYDKKNCNPNNLITLCRDCHSKTNYNRKYWEQYFQHKCDTIQRRLPT